MDAAAVNNNRHSKYERSGNKLTAGNSTTATGMAVYNNNESIINGAGTGLYIWDGAKWRATLTITYSFSQDNPSPVTICYGTQQIQ